MRDLPFLDAAARARLRRERLFELCHQEQRAANSAAASAADRDGQISDEEMIAIRERAVGSFARPA